MRILTVRQPWAWSIVHGGKDVENRVRNIAGGYRGPVAIHAGLRDDADAWDEIEAGAWRGPADPSSVSLVRGAIIGVVDLVDVHWAQGHRGCYREADVLGWVPWDGRDRMEEVNGEFVHRPEFCSVWGEHAGPREARVAHLALANPRPLVDPIPFRGALGLRELDPTTTTRVLKALAA